MIGREREGRDRNGWRKMWIAEEKEPHFEQFPNYPKPSNNNGKNGSIGKVDTCRKWLQIEQNHLRANPMKSETFYGYPNKMANSTNLF